MDNENELVELGKTVTTAQIREKNRAAEIEGFKKTIERVQQGSAKKRRRRYGARMTEKQALAFDFMAKGLPPKKAMIKAGYSPLVARNFSTKFLESPAIQTAVETMNKELKYLGVDAKYWANKFREWSEAREVFVGKDGKKYSKPDYKTQISAYDRAKDILGLKVNENELPGGIKRKIELVEYVMGDEHKTSLLDTPTSPSDAPTTPANPTAEEFAKQLEEEAKKEEELAELARQFTEESKDEDEEETPPGVEA